MKQRATCKGAKKEMVRGKETKTQTGNRTIRVLRIHKTLEPRFDLY